MIVYSETIVQFIQEIKHAIKNFLSYELRLKVSQNRFFDQKNYASYPIRVVIYNHKNKLGYFDPDFYELGFHEQLMHINKEQLHNIIRHELAHYMVFIEHGYDVEPHGPQFRTFCQTMGWGKEIYQASLHLEITQNTQESPLLRKIKKLMALGSSSNQNEAELAMIKSQELLLKHNIEFVDTDERVFLKRILKEKRDSAKMRAIAKILETFFVSTIYNRACGFTYLEILGTKTNIEIAEYVATVLQSELDHLWNKAPLKGTIAKNSFFLGIAKGYCNKLHSLKKEHAQAVLVIENQLTQAKAMAYPHLIQSKSHARFCPTSSAIGEQVGRNLHINPAITTSSTTLELL